MKNKINEIQVEKNLETKQLILKQRNEIMVAEEQQNFEREKFIADKMAEFA